MPKKNINHDMNAQWNIEGDNQTWTLGKNATLSVPGMPAVEIEAGNDGNTVKLFGDIVSLGALGRGVDNAGDDNRILVGKASEISANLGIYNNGEGVTIKNSGEIDASAYGIFSSSVAVIHNRGQISGDEGIDAAAGSTIVNAKSGMITANTFGIFIGGSEDTTIVNHGTISANEAAIVFKHDGDFKIVNTGKIYGDIAFQGGDDIIDTRKGEIYGTVSGGNGDDVYKLGITGIDLFEKIDSGHDTVITKSSHQLGDNFEDLTLIGKNNAVGIGNDARNVINGNNANNVLYGNGGHDSISGFGGTDTMHGGDGQDTFMFMTGHGKDTIADFVDGDDYIWLRGFEGINGFDDLEGKITQHGDDVWISFGKGDRLVLTGKDVADLDETDFSFLP